MDEFIDEIKDVVAQIDRMSKSLQQKNKLKRDKEIFYKEVERFRTIFSQLNSRSSFGSSKIADSFDEKQLPPMDHPRVHQIQYSQVDRESQSYIIGYENQVLQENQEEYNKIVFFESVSKETNVVVLKNCMDEIAKEVLRQDEDLDIVTDLTMQTQQNVSAACGELKQANKISKSSRKWYYVMLLIVVILVGLLILLLYVFSYY